MATKGPQTLGYNTLMIWPMLEAMPDSLLPSDRAQLEKLRQMIDLLHHELEMHVYLAATPNVGVVNEPARIATFEQRHFNRSPLELKRDLATALPLMTISQMLGVAQTDAPHLRALSALMMVDSTDPHRVRAQITARRELEDYFLPLIESRAKAPGEDLISMLSQAERQGIFTSVTCISSVIHLLIAGHETTINLICSGVLAFIRNPEQWDLLRSDPDNLCAAAVEECLRYDAPVKLLPGRICSRDVEVGGKLIRAGDIVTYVIASANRDPRVFPDPDMFDITRSPNQPRPYVFRAYGTPLEPRLLVAEARCRNH